ncbi:MAG: ClbS/DfsB family four-helix bundle protein, partial [Anaerolineales bacterium]
EWSLKDVIAHLTWHENEMIGMIRSHAFKGSDLWDLITDERNAIIHEENRDKSLQQVQDESNQIHQQLMELLPTLSDEDLTNPENFIGMPPDWQPWTILADNTYQHYQHHIRDLKRWIAA